MAILLFWISFKAGVDNSVAMLAGKIVLGIIVYVGALFTLKTFPRKEIGYLKRAFS